MLQYFVWIFFACIDCVWLRKWLISEMLFVVKCPGLKLNKNLHSYVFETRWVNDENQRFCFSHTVEHTVNEWMLQFNAEKTKIWLCYKSHKLLNGCQTNQCDFNVSIFYALCSSEIAISHSSCFEFNSIDSVRFTACFFFFFRLRWGKSRPTIGAHPMSTANKCSHTPH